MEKVSVDHGGIARCDALEGIRTIAGADVDPEIPGLGRLFAVLRLQEMTCFPADHAKHVAAIAGDPDALPNTHLVVPAADLVEPQKAVVVDVRDLQSDFVDVSLDHDDWSARLG